MGSEILDSKHPSHNKSKERPMRHATKIIQQGANINLTVTNSRHAIQNAPTKNKPKPS